jgi:TctA family transporter
MKIDWIVETIAGVTFIGLIVFAIYYYVQNKNINALIPLTFGLFGLWGVIKNTKRLLSKPKETLYWLKMHIGNMLGSYIGAITAFVVNQSEHIPLPPIALWLGPAAILVPIIMFELKKVKTQPL